MIHHCVGFLPSSNVKSLLDLVEKQGVAILLHPIPLEVGAGGLMPGILHHTQPGVLPES